MCEADIVGTDHRCRYSGRPAIPSSKPVWEVLDLDIYLEWRREVVVAGGGYIEATVELKVFPSC